MKYDSRLSGAAPRLSVMASCLVLGFGATASMPVGSASTYLAAPARTPQTRNNQVVRNNAPVARQHTGERNRQRWQGVTLGRSSAVPQGGGATTIVVENCDDSGPGSLRQALGDAGNGDTVDLTGLACNTITLTSGALTSTDTLTIQGPGRDQLTIDGNANGLVLDHAYGTLNIHGLTLTNGRTTDGYGGCTLIGSNLVMVDSRVADCAAGDGTNDEVYGAGLNVIGSLTLINSIVSGNTAISTGGGIFGGGVYVGGTAYVVGGSQISGNTADAQGGFALGGGLFALGTVVVAQKALIADNRLEADGVAYGGGFHSATTSVVSESTVSGNSAHSRQKWSYGGGIQVGHYADYESSTLVLAASTISGNTSSAECGSCFIMGGGAQAFGDVLTKYSTINDNAILSAADSSGGAAGGGLAISGYYASSQLTVINSTISGNRTVGGMQGYGHGFGGGVAALGGPFSVTGSTVAFNTASHSGGGITGRSSVSNNLLRSSIVFNNQAPESPDITSNGYGYLALPVSGSHNLVTMAGNNADLPIDTLDDDPLLQPLAMNGGVIATHALGEGSPAIDAGDNPEATTSDQRGAPFLRVFGAAPDIGAFEVQGDPYPIFSDGFED